jgi:hypothetical protein
VQELVSPEKNRPSVEVTPRKDSRTSPLKSKLQKEVVVMSSSTNTKTLPKSIITFCKDTIAEINRIRGKKRLTPTKKLSYYENEPHASPVGDEVDELTVGKRSIIDEAGTRLEVLLHNQYNFGTPNQTPIQSNFNSTWKQHVASYKSANKAKTLKVSQPKLNGSHKQHIEELTYSV